MKTLQPLTNGVQTSLAEVTLSCNPFLALEYYGLKEEKRGFVTFGLVYRFLLVIFGTFILYIVFGTNTVTENPHFQHYREELNIALGIISLLIIAYNVLFKIQYYQIQVIELMKNEEELRNPGLYNSHQAYEAQTSVTSTTILL